MQRNQYSHYFSYDSHRKIFFTCKLHYVHLSDTLPWISAWICPNSHHVYLLKETFSHLSPCWLITNWSLPGGRSLMQPRGLSSRLHQDAAHCLLPRSAQLSSALWPARDDKSPSQPVLIGGPRGLYKGKEGGDWLCFTENIITPLNAGGPTEFPRPRNGDDHPGWEYMTWLTEALSPIWKPNCEA